jgi:glutamate mutase epsilon subunit
MRDKIKSTLQEFAKAYGTPSHIKDSDHMDEVIDIYTRELSKHYSNATINKAISVAWSKARRFPVVADFFEGFGGTKHDEPDLDGYDL